ncbi:hypothetical protein CO155_00130 [Candidatus Pacearchaeota archaeon CG_4_9_14_3_um_filter_35_19]|nr:MAG: hypothetical protein CO155_00130 [Candidatus Pacearchaeota archaeon CG_4_9_14_3_um_filter_35_19]PJB94050.1 MAG: hypothetical protein CO081_03050 [Candidatus Pacearchaeota archaeon CG_4_9_14_0_8_um_filter_35_24]
MKKSLWILLIFNLAYILGFAIYYASIKNYEFLGYIALLVILFLLVTFTYKYTTFSDKLLWALTVWGLLHMLGGGLIVGGAVLYRLQLIPIWITENFYVLRMDQFIHAYLYFVVVFVIWHLLKGNLNKNMNKWLVLIIVGLASVGIGGLNEIIEFMMVLFLDKTGVGGYYNTLWDIVSNTVGAILGVLLLAFMSRSKKG